MSEKKTGAKAERERRGAGEPPRLLIEEWLPAAAIGVECIRERSTGQQPPDKRLHVWWARRPLCVSRAAVLASLLPADFPRDVFERLLGFGKPGKELVAIRQRMDQGVRVEGGFGCDRAFKWVLYQDDLAKGHSAARRLWGGDSLVLDPMAGGGSIPLESARLGFCSIASEYNPVACLAIEATADYPLRLGERAADRARRWAKAWMERAQRRLATFYPVHRDGSVHAYVFARTVPCPDTGFATPLVPDWHVLKPKGGTPVVAAPIVDKAKGTWRVDIRELGRYAGQIKDPPPPTWGKGKGVSLFTGRQIPSDYIKAMAQQGQMRSALYAVVLKTPQGLRFEPPEEADRRALEEAEGELARLRPQWEKNNIIPTEEYPQTTTDERPRLYGMPRWADLFAPRQLLCMGVLVEELRRLRPEIVRKEGQELGEAVVHLLAFILNKFLNHNCNATRWENTRGVVKGKMDRHDYAFKATYAELAPCNAGAGLAWAIDNVLESYEDICRLPRHEAAKPAEIHMGSATNLAHIADGSVTAVVVDPPYADNVQYSEMADFFYVWLKRTQGHRRPEWFSTYLCERDQEAVVNVARHRGDGAPTRTARQRAHVFYQKLMADVFGECRRVLRDDGALTVLFTHKKQEAWEALFASLIEAGFLITATWPVKTESEHSLHQARKNAAQSTVILAARKRPAGAGLGWLGARMREAIGQAARRSAERLRAEGLNELDQLVGSFGPAMEVFSRYEAVRTDVGEPVGVGRAIAEASRAVVAWRIEQLAARGLEGVEPEGQFYLLCWDVLKAAEFRFDDAKLLGNAAGIGIDQLVAAGLVGKTGERIRILSAGERRRERALEPDEIDQTLFGPVVKQKRRTKKDALRVHPNDPRFRTALDACHALALRHIEAGGGAGGVGSAKSLALRQAWAKDSPAARLMEALVRAAPEAVRFEEKGKKTAATAFPEFRAWHALLKPLFGVEPPQWEKKRVVQRDMLEPPEDEAEDEEEAPEEEAEDGGEGEP